MMRPTAIALMAALIPILVLASNGLSPAAAQSTVYDHEQDREWLQEQKRLDEGLKHIRDQADAIYRELTDTNDQQDVRTAAPAPPENPVHDNSRAAQATARQMQEFLKDAGCYHGAIDGVWGEHSLKAWAEFARHSKIKRGEPELRSEWIGFLRETYRGSKVCPPGCDARHQMENGKCVPKSCAGGQRLTSRGKCAPVRFGSLCEAGTRRLAESDCHFWRSMMMEDRHKGLKSSGAIAKYNCQCR